MIKILLGQRPLNPEIQSFEKFYIEWVKITVSNLLVDQSAQDYTSVERSVSSIGMDAR